MMIGEKDTSKKAYVIAEAGTAYAGSVKTATQYVEAASNAGADAIKFQMFTPREELFCPLEGDENRWAWWNHSMLRFSQWVDVADRADELGIHFLASVFQHTGIKWLKQLDPPAWKVASRAVVAFPYNDVPGPFLISCGFGCQHLAVNGAVERAFLWCLARYPTDLKSARMFDGHEGLSDHSGTIYPALDAMARGAQVIEVHIKLNEDSHDAASAIFPYDLRQITEARDAFAQMRQD